MFFVEGVRVDKGAVARGGLGAVVEDPDNLRALVCVVSRSGREERTEIMESRM